MKYFFNEKYFPIKKNYENVFESTFQKYKTSSERIKQFIKLQDLKRKEELYEIRDKTQKKVDISKLCFIRKGFQDKSKEYIPKTDLFTPIHRKLNSTLYQKYVRLKGFTNHSKKRINTEVYEDDLESIINSKNDNCYENYENNKTEKKEKLKINLKCLIKPGQIKNLIKNNDIKNKINNYSSRNNISNYSTTLRTFSKSKNNTNNYSLKNRIKLLKPRINKLCDNYKILDIFIQKKMEQIKWKAPTNKVSIYFNSKKKEQKEKYKIPTPSPMMRRQKTEDYYKKKMNSIKKMTHVPWAVKEKFRDTFTKVLYERHILNIEDQLDYFSLLTELHKKNRKDFKTIAQERMNALNDNYVTDKDDALMLKEEKEFTNNYMNFL